MYDTESAARFRSTGFGYGILILAGLTSCTQENTTQTGAATEPVQRANKRRNF